METGHQKFIRDLRPGERVLTSSGSDGSSELAYSQVLAFLDRDPATQKLFYTLQTEAGARLSLTAAHLLLVSEGNCSEGARRPPGALRTVYASDAQPGHCVLVVDGKVGQSPREGRLSRITRVTARERRGAFAPLTEQGTLVVDGVVVSCYALVDKHSFAHLAFSPLRLMHSWIGTTGYHGDGVHWYSRLLHWLGRMLLDADRLHPLGVTQADR